MPYAVPPTDIVSVEIDGETARFPVQRIFCVGRNYVAHIREMGGDQRDPPCLTSK
jgi:fumarylpyruvate hydrolase